MIRDASLLQTLRNINLVRSLRAILVAAVHLDVRQSLHVKQARWSDITFRRYSDDSERYHAVPSKPEDEGYNRVS